MLVMWGHTNLSALRWSTLWVTAEPTVKIYVFNNGHIVQSSEVTAAQCFFVMAWGVFFENIYKSENFGNGQT